MAIHSLELQVVPELLPAYTKPSGKTGKVVALPHFAWSQPSGFER